MENTTLIIEEKEKEDAKALTQSFVRTDVRSRAFVNALGSEICLKYLRDNNISDEKTYNLHNIRKILEEFDISDVILSNIHIDVRVVYDENEIFIPKTHFDYNLTPDVYMVLKISKNFLNTEFLGFFEPKMLNKNNANDKYYFIEKEKLSSPLDFKAFVENYEGKTSIEYSEKEMEDAEFLIVSMADHNVNEEDKKKLLEYLKTSAKLRDKFIEFENFEMLAYQAVNIVGIDPKTDNNAEIIEQPEESSIADIEDLGIEDLNLNEEDIKEDTSGEENSVLGGFVEGAAILGAEIAGTAMASAALAGTAEGAQIAKDTADTALSAIEAGKEFLEPLENIPEGLTSINNETPQEASPLEIMDDIASSNEVSDLGTEDNLIEFTSGEDELTIEDTANDIDFEGLEFTNNDDYDDIVFENNEEYDDYDSEHISISSGSSSGGSSVPKIQPVVHTPISEATDLVSIDNIQSGNLQPEERPHSDFDEIDTLGVEEFQNLVDKYIPQEIKDESPTTNFDSVDETNKQLAIEHDQMTQFNENVADMADIPEVKIEEHEVELDEENLPELDEIQISDNSLMKVTDDLSSDDFVQEMPEEINSTEPVVLEEEIPLADMENLQEESSDSNDIKEETLTDESVDMEELVPEELVSEELVSEGSTEEQTEETVQASADIPETDENIENNIEITEDYSLSGIASANDLSILDELDDLTLSEEEPLNTENMQEESIDSSISESQQTEQPVTDETLSEAEPVVEINEEEIVKTVDAYEENMIESEPVFPEENSDESIEYINPEEGESSDYTENNEVEYINDSEEEEPQNDSLGVLYTGETIPEIENSEVAENQDENTDFRPKKNNKVMVTVLAVAAAIVIAGSIAGIYLKNRNSIETETVIQPNPENELISPETDNTGVLLNGIEPAIPTDTADISPSAPAPEVETAEQPAIDESNPQTENTPEPVAATEVKEQKPAVAPAVNEPKKPLNANKTITLKKVSWEIPNYLSYSDNIKEYLQSAGKSIRLTLSSDLLLTSDYIYSNQVKVKIQLTKDGVVENAQIVKSSGSEQVDKIVLQTVKETLNVVKPTKDEVPTSNFKLGLIIYL